ncbi:GtrA family protein [Legionella sp. D16C41]|uniref:GtrA family protein n=1 Tax=Legionella sp. D16C41 TaxID=3402688 RepID=UPI003AF7E76F
MKFIKPAVKKQMFGFAVAGLLSTLIMFILYVCLYKVINYQYAYLIAYCISIIALYFMNSAVFKRPISVHTFLKFPLIYLLQYLLGAAALQLLVWFGFSITFAPLLVIIILLPLTFLLNRIVFAKRSNKY